MTVLKAAKAVIMTRKAFQACLPEQAEKWIDLHLKSLDNLETAVKEEDARTAKDIVKDLTPKGKRK